MVAAAADGGVDELDVGRPAFGIVVRGKVEEGDAIAPIPPGGDFSDVGRTVAVDIAVGKVGQAVFVEVCIAFGGVGEGVGVEVAVGGGDPVDREGLIGNRGSVEWIDAKARDRFPHPLGVAAHGKLQRLRLAWSRVGRIDAPGFTDSVCLGVAPVELDARGDRGGHPHTNGAAGGGGEIQAAAVDERITGLGGAGEGSGGDGRIEHIV